MTEIKRRPLRAICIDCGEDYPLYMFGKNAKSPTGHNEMCKACEPPKQSGLFPFKEQMDWGVTVVQQPELIAAAWADAMKGRTFGALAFKRHTIAGRVET